MNLVKCHVEIDAVGCCRCGTRVTLRDAWEDRDAPSLQGFYCPDCALKARMIQNDGRIDQRPAKAPEMSPEGLWPLPEMRG
jgi:NAD-dependent SIR2 family protein deacetylase